MDSPQDGLVNIEQACRAAWTAIEPFTEAGIPTAAILNQIREEWNATVDEGLALNEDLTVEIQDLGDVPAYRAALAGYRAGVDDAPVGDGLSTVGDVAHRAERARSVVSHLADLYGMTIDLDDPLEGDTIPTLLGDALCDLMHGYGEEVIGDAWEAGVWHYDNETGDANEVVTVDGVEMLRSTALTTGLVIDVEPPMSDEESWQREFGGVQQDDEVRS